MKRIYKLKARVYIANLQKLRSQLFSTKEEAKIHADKLKELLKDTKNAALERKRLGVTVDSSVLTVHVNSLQDISINKMHIPALSLFEHMDVYRVVFFPFRSNYVSVTIAKGQERTKSSTKPSYPKL